MFRVLFAVICLLSWPAAAAECVGENLVARLSPARQAALESALADLPYRRGLLWQARKDGMRITLIGTYHFADPRHKETMRVVAPYLDDARALLVEAGPDETAQLTRHLQSNPGLIMADKGDGLPDRLSAQQWAEVREALAARGFPANVAERLAPWYAAMMMGMSPCMLAQAGDQDAGGLDQMLITHAQGRDIPIRALEPWDTLFRLFDRFTPEEEVEMVLAALPSARYADDYAQTLIDAYFAGDAWSVWEFGRIDAYDNSGLSRRQVDDHMALGQEHMIDARNRGWIAPLIAAAEHAAKSAADKRGAGGGRGHVIAGFGALHLPGENGVLNLLAQEGWTISPLALKGSGPDGLDETSPSHQGPAP